MAALILPLISNKNRAVYDSTVGVISRLLQSDVAKAGDPQRASEILVRVVKREHVPRVHRITRSLKNAALRRFTQALLVSKPSRMNPSTVMTTRSSTRRLRRWLSRLVTISRQVRCVISQSLFPRSANEMSHKPRPFPDSIGKGANPEKTVGPRVAAEHWRSATDCNRLAVGRSNL